MDRTPQAPLQAQRRREETAAVMVRVMAAMEAVVAFRVVAVQAAVVRVLQGQW